MLDASDVGESLSQSDFQTVHRPDANLDGYCEVEKSTTTHGQSPSLVDEIMNHFQILNSRPVLPPPPPGLHDNNNNNDDDDDLTNYDMQTVVHPPITTNAQGYSYCDLVFVMEHHPLAGVPAIQLLVLLPHLLLLLRQLVYSEIDVLSQTTVKLQPQRPPIKHPAPETAPKPQKRKSEKDEVNNFSLCLETTAELPPNLSQQVSTENVESDLSDNDNLYARVSDVKTKKMISRGDRAPP